MSCERTVPWLSARRDTNQLLRRGTRLEDAGGVGRASINASTV